MKILLTGATGMVGGEVLRAALSDDEIRRVTVLSRKPLSEKNARLNVLIVKDFLDYDAVREALADHDACLWCLGLSQKGTTEEEYTRVTHDYAVAAARAMRNVNPELTFCFLSGMGADSKEKSKVLFARIKGRTENSLTALGGKVYNFRPGYIHPVRERPEPRLEEMMLKPFVRFYRRLAPSYMIDSDDLARVMLEVAKRGYDKSTLEGKDIRKVAKKLGPAT